MKETTRSWGFGLATLTCLAFLATPANGDFNDILQVFCDVDLVTSASCDATADGMRTVHTVAVSSDDKHVYICSSLPDTPAQVPLQNESLSSFSRSATGTLTLVDQEIEDSGGVDTLASCRGIDVSPDGKHVYTAALTDRAVTWFSRNSMTGALTLVDDVSGGPMSSLAGATSVIVSPDNEHVYVAGISGDSVAAFDRNTTTGDLTSIGDYFDDTSGIDGLNGARDIAVSPDGKHVYVTGQDDNAVAVFSRDNVAASGTFGELTFVEAKFDGVGGVDGLARATMITLDPAGDNVYVGAERTVAAGDWIAVFSRNSTTGALTFLQSVSSNILTVPGLCGGVGPSDSAVAVSPNGLFVAVSNAVDGAVATFSRAADGTLTFIESICDDLLVAGDDDLGAVIDLAMSPDGENLYTAGGALGSLSTLDYECDSPNVDLMLTMDSESATVTETACRSIEMVDMYHVLAAGDLTAIAPMIEVGNDVSFDGLVTLVTGVP